MSRDLLIDKLKTIVGEKGYLAGDDVDARYYTDFRGEANDRPDFILRPASTAELSEILKLCDEAGQAVVPQGGMTGLVTAARPVGGEIPVSLERMNEIESIDQQAGIMVVQAGCQLQRVQEAAEEHGYIFPLDLGARGSCTIGGNLSTNAGGNRVIKYGMMRAMVMGLEAVLADGTVLTSLNKLMKNNAGYDLKQLFIGAEGTLGMVTRVVLRLTPRPSSQSVAFCALDSFADVVAFMNRMQSGLSNGISAFEVLWAGAYDLIVENVQRVRPPLASGHPYYVLLESLGGGGERDREQFEEVLAAALEEGLIADAVIAQSEADAQQIWDVRDGAPEATGAMGPRIGFDVSLELKHMEHFCEELERRLGEKWPGYAAMIFGHLGDGNLHLVISVGPETMSLAHDVDELVYGLVGELEGSISAEHGIGFLKRPFLSHSRSPAELEVMKRLKRALDPNNILSPGRIFQ